MTQNVDLILEIGASFRGEIPLVTDETGRTHRMQIRSEVGSTFVQLELTTGDGITAEATKLTLYRGASVTEVLSLDTDTAHWVYDIESINDEDPDDVRRLARGLVLVSRDVTRDTEPTPAANASKLLTFSLSDGQELTSEEQAHVRAKIGAGGGGGPITTANITDMTDAGRDLATAADAAEQIQFLGAATQAALDAEANLRQFDDAALGIAVNALEASVADINSRLLQNVTADEFVAGYGTWQDSAETIPAKIEGDPVRYWRNVSGSDRLVNTTGTPPKISIIDGVPTPTTGPVSGGYFWTEGTYQLADFAAVCVVSNADQSFAIGCDGRGAEVQFFTGQTITYNGTTPNLASFAANRTQRHCVSLKSNGSAVTAYYRGQQASTTAGASSSLKQIVWGALSLDGLVPSKGTAFHRLSIVAASAHDAAVEAYDSLNAGLTGKPIVVLYTDSHGYTTKGQGDSGFAGHDGMAWRLAQDYEVLPGCNSGGFWAGTDNASYYAAVLGALNSRARRRWLALASNDLFTGSAATLASAIEARTDQLVLDGLSNDEIIICIPPYRVGGTYATYNTRVDDFATIASAWPYTIIDLRPITDLCPDGVHLNRIGCDKFTALVRDACF